MCLPHQFTKDSFGPIAPDRIPKSLSDDNADATRGIVHLVRQEVEEGVRNSATLTFDDLNITIAAQKNAIPPLSFRCHWKGVFLRRFLPFMIPEKTLEGR